MDQGFTAEGFSPSSAAAKVEQVAARVPHRSAPHAPKPHTSQSHAPEQGMAEVASKGVALHHEAAQGERSAEKGLRNVQSKLMLPGMMEFSGAIVAWPLVWVAKKANLPKMTATVESLLKAPVSALRDTSVKDAFQLPANYMKAVAVHAEAAGVDTWASSATAKAGKLVSSGASAQNHAAEFAKPLTQAVEKFSQTGLAKAMPNILKSNLGKAGGMSSFAALMVAGVAAGVGATLFGARAESKEAKAAFGTLLADMGGNKESGFAKAVKASYASKGKWSSAKVGLEMVGSAAEGVMWAKPGFGGMALMGGMMLPQIGASLVPDSPVLGGYMALKQADAGALTLDTEARAQLIKQMIAVMPNVAAHGGLYHKLVAPMADTLVERKMSAAQVAQLLGNEQNFNAFADEIAAKQKAAQSVAAPSQVASPMPQTKAEAAYAATEKPAPMVSGSHKAVQGTVAGHQLQIA